jgi:hypothetical protein
MAGQIGGARAIHFHKSLLRTDVTRPDFQRHVWKLYKLVDLHPAEDSELVRHTAELLKARKFGESEPTDD